MIDKKLEEKIKQTQIFIEFWTKFHELYNNALSENEAGPKTEVFLSTRELVNKRFEDTMDFLEFSQRYRLANCYPIYEILSVKDISHMSDEKRKRIDDFWTDSFIFIYAVMKRLKKRRQRIMKFNRFLYIAKKSREKFYKRSKK